MGVCERDGGEEHGWWQLKDLQEDVARMCMCVFNEALVATFFFSFFSPMLDRSTNKYRITMNPWISTRMTLIKMRAAKIRVAHVRVFYGVYYYTFPSFFFVRRPS